MLTLDPHPLLDLRAFVTSFPRPLEQMPVPAEWWTLMTLEAAVPLHCDDEVREVVRALLRHGGFKPTGRSKPASEYLLKAVREGTLASINLAVDACNIVSLHSGLPISVVDLDRAKEPLHVGIAPLTLPSPPDHLGGEGRVRGAAAGASYVFNASGQFIDLGGLLCLFDADGPCANAVKDAERTKTGPTTTRTLSVIWGTKALPGRVAEAEAWYCQLLEKQGAKTERIIS